METKSKDITELLQAYSAGDNKALSPLMEVVYQQLKLIAARYMKRERASHTLQPTALVNEAFLRLIQTNRVTWQNRAHFFGVAATMMRRVLLDHARKKHAGKRGGRTPILQFDEGVHSPNAGQNHSLDLIVLDLALEDLAKIEPLRAKLVELRYFGGLSLDEAALILGCSTQAVRREWLKAKAWLFATTVGK